jgi:hypothetical protein
LRLFLYSQIFCNTIPMPMCYLAICMLISMRGMGVSSCFKNLSLRIWELFLYVRSEVLVVVNMKITVIWDVTPYSLVDRYILLEPALSIFRAEKPLLPWRWRKQVLQNVDIFLPDYTVSHSRRR